MSRSEAPTVLFWADAGPTIGLGHVSRVLALAEALAERGAGCRFALPPDVTALAWLRAAGFAATVPLPEREPRLREVLAAAAGASAVVVDVRHPLAPEEVRALGGGRRVAVVDNPGAGVVEADLVVAPAAAARDDRWLAGPAYVPLGRAFAEPPRRRASDPPVVLVSMGGSQLGDLVLRVLDALACACRRAEFTVRVLANPLAPVWSRLPDVLRVLGFPPAIAIEPGRMSEHLAGAHVALLAMGVSVYEALASGVPAFVLCRTADDATHARVLEASGGLASLGVHWTLEHLAAAVADAVADPDRRAAMGRAGRALVDGRGAARVAERLLALLPATGRSREARAHG